MKRTKAGYAGKSKTELEQTMMEDWKSKFISSNKEHEIKFEWKPSNMN